MWRNSHFLKLWGGQVISALGSEVTRQALPLTAIIFLRATPEQMGFLNAAITAPALLASLFIGVWVDRLRRRPLLIWSDLGRMLLLSIISILAWFQLLRIEYLYLISFAVGLLTVLFDIAVTSYMTSLVPSERLIEGNGKMELSSAVSAVAGPSIAAVLIQLLTAPLSILLDSLSFLASALCVGLIMAPEPPQSGREQRRMWQEIGEGLQTMWQNTFLRDMTIASSLGALAIAIQQTVLFLYIINSLHLSPVFVGILLTGRGIAAIIGAALAGYIGRRFGPGPAIVGGTFVVAFGSGLLLIGFGSPLIAAGGLILGQALYGVGTPVYSVNQLSLRQAITPNHLLGRVNASRRFLVFGAMPIGALAGGMLGVALGLYLTLMVSAFVMALSFLAVFWSPIRSLRSIPRSQSSVVR